jgi:hypothetical protein
MTVIGHGYDDNVGAPAFRNLIINGNMSVAQRATSAALGNRTYTSVDRWNLSQDGTPNGASSQITSGLPTNFKYGLKIGRNNGATQTGAIVVTQVLESVDSYRLRGKQVTLSFWAKKGANYSASSSVLNVEVATGTGTDQAASGFYGAWTGTNVLINSPVTLTTSWVYYTLTGTVSATANQIGLDFYYVPTGTAGADDNLYITGVQLEAGSVATPFEFEPFETTFRKCQRYFCKSTPITETNFTTLSSNSNMNSGAVWCVSGTNGGGIRAVFPVEMRAVPSVDFTAWTSSNTNVSNGGSMTMHAPGLGDVGGILEYKSQTGLSIYTTASTSYRLFFFWRASAEL